jgi:hypothetical protein
MVDVETSNEMSATSGKKQNLIAYAKGHRKAMYNAACRSYHHRISPWICCVINVLY